MSLKFRRDGAVFPTEVIDGNLIVKMGTIDLKFPFPFLKRNFSYDCTNFPMSNILCYLKDDEGTIIMRFDGTVTVYDNDDVVIGFTKFNVDDIYQYTSVIPHGAVSHMSGDRITHQTKCFIYVIKDRDELFLEVINDSEPIMFTMKDNVLFLQEVLKGNRYFPRLLNYGANQYGDDDGKYIIVGTPIKNTGYVMI